MSPAGTAVDGDVLVDGPTHKIFSTHVSPVPGKRDISGGEVLEGLGRFNDVTGEHIEGDFAGLVSMLWFWLLEVIVGCGWGLVSDRISPGINGGSEGAISFDSEVIDSSDNLEESVDSPVGSPGISAKPILGSVLNTPSNDGDIVGNSESTGGIVEDSTRVVSELLGDSHSAGNWSTVVDFVHHVLLSLDWTVLINSVDVRVWLSPTSLLSWGTILTLDL